MFSTVGDAITTLEGISTWGNTNSTFADVQYSGKYHQYIRGLTSLGDTISTVEDVQFCGGKTST